MTTTTKESSVIAFDRLFPKRDMAVLQLTPPNGLFAAYIAATSWEGPGIVIRNMLRAHEGNDFCNDEKMKEKYGGRVVKFDFEIELTEHVDCNYKDYMDDFKTFILRLTTLIAAHRSGKNVWPTIRVLKVQSLEF